MLRIEHQRPLEYLTRPAVLLSSQSRIANTDVQIHGVRVERQPLLQRVQCRVVVALIVMTMGEFVVLLGAEERVGHSGASFSILRESGSGWPSDDWERPQYNGALSGLPPPYVAFRATGAQLWRNARPRCRRPAPKLRCTKCDEQPVTIRARRRHALRSRMPAIRCGSAVVPISHLIDICSRSLLGSQQAIPSPRARENHRAMTRDRACGNDVAKLIRAIRDARFGSELKCPRCQSVSVCRWGRFAGRQRYRCGTCRRTFSDLTGTPVAWSKCLGSLPAYRDCMRGSASLRASARSVGVHLTTSFRWRHRLLDGACNEEIVRLCGFVETGTARVICTDTRTWMSNRRRSIAR